MDSYVDLLNLNFMYSLRTGNLLTDMMIAALLPLVSGAIAYLTRTWWPQLVSRIISYFSNVDSTSATFKTFEQGSGLYYGNTLRVALSLYVTNVLKPRFDVAELKYISVPGKSLQDATSYTDAMRDYCFVDAGPAKELPMRLTKNLELKQNEAGENNEDEGNKLKGTQGGTKKVKRSQESLFTITQYIHSFPSLMEQLRMTRQETEKDPEVSEAVAQLERDASASGDLIQSLLDRSLEHYRLQYKEAAKKTERYLYQPLLMPLKHAPGSQEAEKKNDTRGAMKCNFYPLRSEKTFQSLFFPAKQRLIQLIDDFEQKTGKYAIPGYPQKLVLLLYGPPGTGKTSLAKAVAAYTKRHLFAISLSRIRNNEELLKYMFSDRVKVKKEKASMFLDYGHKKEDTVEVLDPAKLVYILEDVDATTTIVLKDEPKESEPEEDARKQRKTCKAEATTTPPPSSAGSDIDMGDDKKSDETAEEREGSTEYKSEDGDGDATDEISSGKMSTPPTKTSTERELVRVKNKNQKFRRALTIEGLTNALNGVLDFPQRIVIMTTNHIEKLHPSLLRPGVVTMKLHMHNFDAACAVDMIKHYFSHTTLLPAQLEELRSLVEAASPSASKVDTTVSSYDDAISSTQDTRGFSPAELEQRCAECDTIEELLETLRQGSRVNIF
ncbi:hypothetical protein JKF63_02133 [Porcisia hertigi]|uniref:AAA+ ATPase domain-containing protein n=1 Tax=Porcisia hertigi TaxID=2761500 RepID=A0A836L590_9TRYP|nr:hypothetical protein JKF63_02133 [Porcisia hertigi]